MQSQMTNRFNLGVLVSAVLIAAVAVLSGVMATRAYDDDGRLNLVTHLGGDAVFCVGANKAASNSFDNGGIQLLSQNGQELFYVPVATIDAVPELPAVNTLIAEGLGSHGPVELWRLTGGDFLLIGQDEHGKPYQFQWSGCGQVGPIPGEVGGEAVPGVTATPEPDCDEPEYDDIVWLLQSPDDCPAVTPEWEWPR